MSPLTPDQERQILEQMRAELGSTWPATAWALVFAGMARCLDRRCEHAGDPASLAADATRPLVFDLVAGVAACDDCLSELRDSLAARGRRVMAEAQHQCSFCLLDERDIGATLAKMHEAFPAPEISELMDEVARTAPVGFVYAPGGHVIEGEACRECRGLLISIGAMT